MRLENIQVLDQRGGTRTENVASVDDMRELARLSLAEVVDAMQVLSEGALAKQTERGLLSARARLLAARLALDGARHLRVPRRHRQSAGRRAPKPARSAVGAGRSGHPAAVVPQLSRMSRTMAERSTASMTTMMSTEACFKKCDSHRERQRARL